MVLRYSEAILRSLASQPSVRKKEIEPNAREELLRLQVEEQYLEYLESSVNIRLCDVELACFSSLRRHYLSAIEGQRKLTDELSRLKPDKLSILGSALAIYGEVRAADEEEVVMYRVIPVDEREIYAVYQPFAPAAPDSGDAGFGPETAGRGNSLAHHDGKDSISALHQHRISRIVMVPAP
jgi:hypothetical protein